MEQLNMRISKTDRLFNALREANGTNVPVRQLVKRTGLANISAAISVLRSEGFSIYLNTRKHSGRVVKYYRLAA